MNSEKERFLRRLTRQSLSLLGINQQEQQTLSSIPLSLRLKVSLFAALALWLVTSSSLFIAQHYSSYILLASMGASSVLLFGLPNSPLASPWSFIAGHFIAAAIGVSCSILIDDFAFMAAATIALTMLCMYTFGCMHPPGGATALVPVFAAYEQPLDYGFLIYPVASSVVILLLLSFIFKRWVLQQPLIQKQPQFDPKHLSQNPPPLKRGGLQAEDFLRALNSADTVVDISERDLESLYQKAKGFAYQRQRDTLTCASIMSQHVITVTSTTPAEDAWKLFHKHKISSLPVVKKGRLIGMLSSVDFLKSLTSKHHSTLAKTLTELLQKSGLKTGAMRTVADFMVPENKLLTALDSSHLVTLIPLLSDAGYHNIPVIDYQKQLVGIITQSDLIAALYNQLQYQADLETK